MRVSIIAAIGKKNELGANNTLLWHIPGELPRFKRITNGHPIIMGRKTFTSIGRVLPGRTNIIISKNPTYSVSGAVVVSSLTEAIRVAKENETEELFIIGGGQIFAQALPLANRLYLTIVDASFPTADVFFPDFSSFTKVIEKEENMTDTYHYTFITLEKM